MLKNRRVSITDFDKLAEEIPDIVYLNEVLLSEPDKNILDILFQSTDCSLEFVPMCKCRTLAGLAVEGHVCPCCGTTVSSEFTAKFLPKNWVRIPENMPSILHPIFYLVLKNWAGRLRIGPRGTKNAGKKQKVPIIDFVLNPEEVLPDDLSVGIHGQGYTYFMDHFDEIMDFLCYKHPKYSASLKTPAIIKFMEMFHDRLFIRQFPILHTSFHPIHVSSQSREIDATADIILSAIIDLSSAKFASKHSVVRRDFVDKQLWNVYTKYVEYVRNVIQLKIGDKYALVRRHAVAARVHFSGRGVITPIISRHMGDELHVSWPIMLNGYKLEIINLLVNRFDYSPTQALRKVMAAFTQHDPEIDKIFKILIRECPYKGLPATFDRNPTLLKTSNQLFFIPHVIPDVRVKVIRLPPRVCNGFNADFDGDEMNLLFIKEMGMVPYLMTMHPREAIFSQTSLGLSNLVGPTKETFLHGNAFIQNTDTEDFPCELTLD